MYYLRQFVKNHEVALIRATLGLTVLVVAILVLYGFGHQDLVHSTLAVVIGVLAVSALVWAIRHRQMLAEKNAAHHRRTAEHKRIRHEALLTTVTPSNFTVANGGFSEAELASLTYDRPLHWVIFVAMLFNPFWLEDNRPQRVEARFPDQLVAHGFRISFWILRGLYTVIFAVISLGNIGVFAARSLLEQRLGNSLVSNPLFWVVAAVVHLVLTAVWAIYIYRMWQQCRQVKTARTVGIIARQLPWTSYPGQLVPLDTYTQCQPDRPLAGKLFGYRHIGLRTTEDPEPLPELWYVADGPRLEAQLQEQRKRNQEHSAQPMRTTAGKRFGRVIPRTGPR